MTRVFQTLVHHCGVCLHYSDGTVHTPGDVSRDDNSLPVRCVINLLVIDTTTGLIQGVVDRALCRTKLLPVTHVLVDTWMLTVNLVYKLSNAPDDLKWTIKHTYDTIYTHF